MCVLTNSMMRVEHLGRCVLLGIHLLQAFQYISLRDWLASESPGDQDASTNKSHEHLHLLQPIRPL